MVQDEEHKEEEEEDDFQTDEDEEMEVDEQVTSKRKKASFLNMYLKWCVCVSCTNPTHFCYCCLLPSSGAGRRFSEEIQE